MNYHLAVKPNAITVIKLQTSRCAPPLRAVPDLLFLTFPYLCLSRGKRFLYFYVWVPEVKRKALFEQSNHRQLILYMLGIIALTSPSCKKGQRIPAVCFCLVALISLSEQAAFFVCTIWTCRQRIQIVTTVQEVLAENQQCFVPGSDKKVATCLSRGRNIPQLYQRKTYPVTLSSYKTSHIF